MYADDLNAVAPFAQRDFAALLYANYPASLTDGVACCTRMTCLQIDAYLVNHGIRDSFDQIIGSDTPELQRGFVTMGHAVGTEAFNGRLLSESIFENDYSGDTSQRADRRNRATHCVYGPDDSRRPASYGGHKVTQNSKTRSSAPECPARDPNPLR